MISGPRPGPALSAGSILNNNTFVPGSVDELIPTAYLNASFFPVDPYLKFLKEESLKSSADRMIFFIFETLNVAISVRFTLTRTVRAAVCTYLEITVNYLS